MRIVPNLNDIDECPNCKRHSLIRITNEFGRQFKQCQICNEEIFENEVTCNDSDTEKEKKKDRFIFSLREEVSCLSWNIHDARSMALVNNIQEIFNKIIDYIEEN